MLGYTAAMVVRRNPYDWQSHRPRVEIPRADAERIAGMLAEGGSAVVLGGRGMGKSVFLHQLREVLESSTEVMLVEVKI